MLRTFENATHNNNPPTDVTAAVNHPTVDAAAGGVGDNDVSDDVDVDGEVCQLAAANRTQNNDMLAASRDGVRPLDGTTVRRVASYQPHSLNQSAAGARRGPVSRSSSLTGRQRGRLSSNVVTDRQQSARQAASLTRTAARRGRGSSEHLHHRSLSSSLSRLQQQQQQQQRDSDRPKRQTSQQLGLR